MLKRWLVTLYGVQWADGADLPENVQMAGVQARDRANAIMFASQDIERALGSKIVWVMRSVARAT